MPRKKKLQPSSADLARARATMRALDLTTLYGNGDGAYFRTLAAATAYNSGTTSSLLTYLLD
ncbi:hypothetical protein [Hymenobacter sp. YC55]|uniref:hypothetical protein n=1 Tax=Hymenobacter sp. YC55 TaxID=3034019 RepID=UPI0023F94A7B|nr:hypothetical protein [Hymenobacter sp. YC55]MDF7813610.1 hypothetical protein [Hymenobacter sp. YC55]